MQLVYYLIRSDSTKFAGRNLDTAMQHKLRHILYTDIYCLYTVLVKL